MCSGCRSSRVSTSSGLKPFLHQVRASQGDVEGWGEAGGRKGSQGGGQGRREG